MNRKWPAGGFAGGLFRFIFLWVIQHKQTFSYRLFKVSYTFSYCYKKLLLFGVNLPYFDPSFYTFNSGFP